MRQLIRTYEITGLHEITITGYTFTKEDVRLIIDETVAITDKRASILVSSTAKNNIVSVVSGVITLASNTATLTVGDELTIEIDIDNVAKEATINTATLNILDTVNNQSNSIAATINGLAIAVINTVNSLASSVVSTVNSLSSAIISNIGGQATAVINTVNAQASSTNSVVNAAKDAILANSNEHAVVFAKQGNNEEATNTAILNAIDAIDTSDLAKQGNNPLATNTAILAAIPTECSNEDIDRMFEATSEDDLIIVPSELITPEGTMPIGVFTAITGLTPTE